LNEEKQESWWKIRRKLDKKLPVRVGFLIGLQVLMNLRLFCLWRLPTHRILTADTGHFKGRQGSRELDLLSVRQIIEIAAKTRS
jgi:hypothetical protein